MSRGQNYRRKAKSKSKAPELNVAIERVLIRVDRREIMKKVSAMLYLEWMRYSLLRAVCRVLS
jgi:ERCC4-type nuclease